MSNNVVNATVPVEWLSRFVGFHVWVRPPHCQPDYYQLVDVCIDETGRRNMIVDVDGVQRHALCAQMITVKNVLEANCHKVNVDEYEWWEWSPPAHEPPQWERRTKPQETTITAYGDQFALFEVPHP